jgi:hypothetical protein
MREARHGLSAATQATRSFVYSLRRLTKENILFSNDKLSVETLIEKEREGAEREVGGRSLSFESSIRAPSGFTTTPASSLTTKPACCVPRRLCSTVAVCRCLSTVPFVLHQDDPSHVLRERESKRASERASERESKRERESARERERFRADS